MITLEQISKRLAEAIEQSGMKQSEIAEQLGVCQQTVSHYANRDITPVLDTFANLCKILDLDSNDILCLKD